jgi:tetratricopeptide (TPR) repeat protein
MSGPFSAWRSWRERRLILRDIRRRAADASERNRFKIKDQLIFAESALDNNDQVRAMEICNQLIADYPLDALENSLALRVLIRLRRFDDATSIMRNGRRRHPREPKFLQWLGEIAQAKNDHGEALRLYTELRRRFPSVMEGYTLAADSLRVMKRLDEAEDLAKQAMSRFPEDISPLLEYARLAVIREDWEEALQRWQPVLNRFLYFGGYVGSAQALSHLGRYDEAEELLQQARYRFGTDPGPLSEYARVAEIKGDVAEAVQRWKAVLYRFPLDMYVYLNAADAFEKFAEPAEAVATLHAAIDRFPNELRPMLELAKLLHHKRRDFPAAAEAWAALRKAVPENEEAYKSGADALGHAGLAEAADALREEHRLRFRLP